MDFVEKLQKYLRDASSELKNMKRKFEDEKNQLIADAAQNGDYYLLARRIAERVALAGSRNQSICFFRVSDFQGLSKDNLHDVLDIVRSIVKDRDIQHADQWTDVGVGASEHSCAPEKPVSVRQFSFTFGGKKWYKSSWLDSTGLMSYFGIKDTYMELPSKEKGDCDGITTWYFLNLKTFDTRDTNRVFLVLTPEPKAKRHKPLQA